MLLSLLGAAVAARAQEVSIEPAKGSAHFDLDNANISDLSGITWMGGDLFAAVSDKRNVIQLIRLQIDHETGGIIAGEFGDVSNVPSAAADFEGIAWVAAEKAFYLSAETGNAVLRYVPESASVRTLPVPAVFSKARRNLSLESLTWDPTTREFWIANEEALTPDGPVSSREAGSVVRLQKLDRKARPLAQYAWRTEPASFRYGNAGSGVSDLCVLPTGQLIVLERGFAEAGLHLRLFLADVSKATNTARLPALADANIQVASKTLLFEKTTGFTNFEGLTLGPELADGWRSLIVIADSNGAARHSFFALRVRFVTPPEKSQVIKETTRDKAADAKRKNKKS